MQTQIKLGEVKGLSRRNILKRVGLAAGAMGALAIAADASSSNNEENDGDEIVGLWLTVLSAPDNSFPSFKVVEVYGGGGTYTGSGQPDLTPAALSSTAWGIWERVGQRKFRSIGQYWTYNPDATPSGFAFGDLTSTVSKDGKTYHGEGRLQYFDNNGSPLGPLLTFFNDGTRITFP
jgi:hypothetical protein